MVFRDSVVLLCYHILRVGHVHSSEMKNSQAKKKIVAGGSEPKKKSVIRAYLCWLVGGIFGLHLFYLERDAHAFLTWSTLGGYGLGWLADITKIPRYVRDCNDDPQFLAELSERMRKNRKVSPH